MAPMTYTSLPGPDRSRYGRLIVSVLLLGFALYSILITPEADFMQDYAAARGWWLGLDPNASTTDLLKACCPGVRQGADVLQTAHPPFATVVALPFSFLPWTLARYIWLLMGWAAIVWSWHVQRVNWLVCGVTAGLWLIGLSLGALEPLLLALLAAALFVEKRSLRWTGILIGIAGALKIYPIVLFIGLMICGKWKAVIAGVVSCAVAMLSAELILGHSVTQGWVAYTPVNSLMRVDAAGNNSLVRVAHALIPSASPMFLALILGIVLIIPLISTLRSSDGVRPMLPVMLMISPISWSYYMALLALGTITCLEQILLAISSALLAFVWLRIVPGADLAPIGYGPLLLVMLLMWYRQVRSQLRPTPQRAAATPTEARQNKGQ